MNFNIYIKYFLYILYIYLYISVHACVCVAIFLKKKKSLLIQLSDLALIMSENTLSSYHLLAHLGKPT